MNATPSFGEFVGPLQALTIQPLDPDMALFNQIGVDSIRIVEWLYEVTERYGIDLDDETLSFVENASLSELYERFTSTARLG